MSGPVQVTDGERNIIIDRLTNALMTIDYAHHEIHSGGAFRCGTQKEATANGNLTLSFKTANTTKQAHMVWAVETENSSTVSVYEKSEVTGGSAVTPRNANRSFADSSVTMQSVVKDATVVTTNATVIGNKVIGSNGLRSRDPNLGGAAASRGEWVLKQNTWYTVKITDTSNAAQNLWIGLDWYEHTPKLS